MSRHRYQVELAGTDLSGAELERLLEDRLPVAARVSVTEHLATRADGGKPDE